jgi:uncharacterized protein YbbC (DUF1343 family)
MKNSFSYRILLLVFISFQFTSCAQQQKSTIKKAEETAPKLKVAADRTNLYLSKLKGKSVAIVANQTSVLNVLQRAEVAPNVMGSKLVQHHLVDYLHNYNGINVKKVFSPEHGFRGKEDAGAHVNDGIDTKTGLPILSLHGKSKKPSQEQLKGIDVVVFDIQDVGVRFYTYISTLHYVMEACAELGIQVILLDRPNPNGHYIDGPILEPKHSSFVGKHPVPVVYGMTIGEYGQMINGEKWLKNGMKCDLTVIPLENYTHKTQYSLPIKPSPNLPNDKSINLYPSLGFFEGTTINAGRGTDIQFQIYGAPFFKESKFSYTPKSNDGSKYPKHKEKLCSGKDLRKTEYLSTINLEWLINAYKQTPKKEEFFGKTFTIHAGTEKLQQQLEQNISKQDIKNSWKDGLEQFNKIRSKYLLYK